MNNPTMTQLDTTLLMLGLLVAANLVILVPYVKKNLRQGCSGLVAMFHDCAYYLSFTSLVLLILIGWEKLNFPFWTILIPLSYFGIGMAAQYIYSHAHREFGEQRTSGAMKGYYIVIEALKWPLWIRSAKQNS